MTEQEAEALAGRLEKIWTPKQVTRYGLDFPNQLDFEAVLWGAEDEGQIRLFVYSTFLNANFEPILPEVRRMPVLGSRCYLTWSLEGLFLEARFDGTIWSLPFTSVESCLSTQWLPAFRRNCWLSGCPIEASAHEKAEWSQGFRQEEIEAWNLKM